MAAQKTTQGKPLNQNQIDNFINGWMMMIPVLLRTVIFVSKIVVFDM